MLSLQPPADTQISEAYDYLNDSQVLLHIFCLEAHQQLDTSRVTDMKRP